MILEEEYIEFPVDFKYIVKTHNNGIIIKQDYESTFNEWAKNNYLNDFAMPLYRKYMDDNELQSLLSENRIEPVAFFTLIVYVYTILFEKVDRRELIICGNENLYELMKQLDKAGFGENRTKYVKDKNCTFKNPITGKIERIEIEFDFKPCELTFQIGKGNIIRHFGVGEKFILYRLLKEYFHQGLYGLRKFSLSLPKEKKDRDTIVYFLGNTLIKWLVGVEDRSIIMGKVLDMLNIDLEKNFEEMAKETAVREKAGLNRKRDKLETNLQKYLRNLKREEGPKALQWNLSFKNLKDIAG